MGGELVTKRFNYREVFGNLFKYRYQVDNNNYLLHYHISVERTWDTNTCLNRCHAYFLALTEVNKHFLWGYLVDGVYVEPQLDFWNQL